MMVAIPALLLLAGCGADVRLARDNRLVGAAQALAVPPPGGPAVIGVIERRAPNAVVQEIRLGTSSHVPGENSLDVAYFGSLAAAGASNDPPQDRPLAPAGIARSLRDEFPGIAMRVAPYYVQNAYGPFGYAIGRSGRDLCLYGWQRIGAGEDAPRLFGRRGTVRVRLRYCRTGASEAGLLNVMYGYTLTGFLDDAGWNPFGRPDGPPPGLGRPGHPIYPKGTPESPAEPTEAPPLPKRSATVRTATALHGVGAAGKPAATGPKVPLPAEAAAAGEPRVPLPAPVEGRDKGSAP